MCKSAYIATKGRFAAKKKGCRIFSTKIIRKVAEELNEEKNTVHLFFSLMMREISTQIKLNCPLTTH